MPQKSVLHASKPIVTQKAEIVYKNFPTDFSQHNVYSRENYVKILVLACVSTGVYAIMMIKLGNLCR